MYRPSFELKFLQGTMTAAISKSQPQVSRTPVMKTGVRLRRSSGATALGCTGAGLESVAPKGMPLSDSDMSHRDMRLVSTTNEAAGSDEWA